MIDDTDYHGDGFDVELHTNENESDFYSESDFKEESNEQVDQLRSSRDQRSPITPQRESSEENSQQDFDALFENEKVRNLFNKMLDQKVEAKLKEHKLTSNKAGKSKNIVERW